MQFLIAAILALASLGAGDDQDPHDIIRDEQTLRDAGVSIEGPALLEFFRQRTLNGQSQQMIAELIRKLGDDSYKVRARASSELSAFGSGAVPYLREALKSRDLEVVRRAEDCLQRIDVRETRVGVPAAAVHLLEQRRPAGTLEVLLGYLPFASDEAIADEVERALAALAKSDMQHGRILLAALKDSNPIRRAAAAEALCHLGASAPLSDVRVLLADSDPVVRLRAAVALAGAKEKDAIPVIIDLLAVLPQAHAWLAEDLLLRLAGETGPQEIWKATESGRQQSRESWSRWWTANRDKVDLNQLDRARWLGFTLVVMLDIGAVAELDILNVPRFTIDHLDKPLDAQMLPGDRVLVAEHDGNRVTVRDAQGHIIWEKHVVGPLMAQRLPNGHTFIATKNRLMEFDREGAEVFHYDRPSHESIKKAQKQPNGDIAFVVGSTNTSKFVRIDSAGHELQSFEVEVAYSGGRIDFLPGGRVLVPEFSHNRVVEYDADGNAAWQYKCTQPIAAVRLANGNTLITCFVGNRAVEIDRSGKEVWAYQTNTRVTRAFRR